MSAPRKSFTVEDAMDRLYNDLGPDDPFWITVDERADLWRADRGPGLLSRSKDPPSRPEDIIKILGRPVALRMSVFDGREDGDGHE